MSWAQLAFCDPCMFPSEASGLQALCPEIRTTRSESANGFDDDARQLVSRHTCCNVPAVSASSVAACDIRRVGQPVNRHQLDVIE
jgi:hypothetical protein